ncbi:AraC family transcriptional regulator [Flavivirga spongiicola]|uniref:AraC family transcriptional regulator n=1 Tax=Flavivirga spongiicola TaxID=421621 RepID=A0ABU7XSQ1_9FLAO|nr:AraC family transcriptional regulator [Flavivirga sp. MEBiC05379]MDO5977882.1 AraC family transcriptional regulator [Flavivirga sp. MEBiC05379]
MKLHLLNRDSLKYTSFSTEKHSFPYFLKVWHYHPELELVFSQKGSGTRFVGDSIEQFNTGDIVLIGKNLPHMWLSDKVYFEASPKLISESIVFHFKEDFLGDVFFKTPEMVSIAKLIERSKYGIKFLNTDKKIALLIAETLNKKGFDKMWKFLKILDLLSKHSDYELLASKGYVDTNDLQDNKNFTKVYEYIFKNFNSKINLNSVAKIAHMNASAFSRSFKRLNHKPFSRYLNEIRIGYACKLLLEEKYSITFICYESGYNNLSNFNRQFKLITGTTPSNYLTLRKNSIGLSKV